MSFLRRSAPRPRKRADPVLMYECLNPVRPRMSAIPQRPRAERPVTVPDFALAKSQGKKLAVVTAYDYTFARLFDEAGVDALLIGDSLGMVVQGHDHCL